jgi:hypothetical protein
VIEAPEACVGHVVGGRRRSMLVVVLGGGHGDTEATARLRTRSRTRDSMDSGQADIEPLQARRWAMTSAGRSTMASGEVICVARAAGNANVVSGFPKIKVQPTNDKKCYVASGTGS